MCDSSPFHWQSSFWKVTAVCSLTVSWPTLSYKYLNKIIMLMQVWRARTLTDAAGDALAIDTAVPAKLDFWCIFFYFWKWNYNSAYSAFCVYGQTDGFTYTEVGWSWFWFFLDIASTYSFIKRLLQEEVVENAEWLEHFTVVLGLLYCPFLQNFGRKKWADFSSLPFCIAYLRI